MNITIDSVDSLSIELPAKPRLFATFDAKASFSVKLQPHQVRMFRRIVAAGDRLGKLRRQNIAKARGLNWRHA